jgi:hypothetical protein
MNEKIKKSFQNCKEQVPIYFDSVIESLSEFSTEAYEILESLLEVLS